MGIRKGSAKIKVIEKKSIVRIQNQASSSVERCGSVERNVRSN